MASRYWSRGSCFPFVTVELNLSLPFLPIESSNTCCQVGLEGRTLTQEWTVRKSPHEVARPECVETWIRVLRCSAPVLRRWESGPCRTLYQRQCLSILARGRCRRRRNSGFWPAC